jgi:hypothetical protein
MFLFLVTIAFAGTIAGISFPDSVQLNGQKLYLNGMGLREKYWVDVYAAGLYVTNKTNKVSQIIESNSPKRLHTQFIYSDVPKQKMIDTLKENLQRNPNISRDVISQIDEAAIWMEDFTTGDEIIFDYVPDKGTTFIIKGVTKGTITGVEFMQALFNIYVGEYPASEQLKQGLLGK